MNATHIDTFFFTMIMCTAVYVTTVTLTALYVQQKYLFTWEIILINPGCF